MVLPCGRSSKNLREMPAVARSALVVAFAAAILFVIQSIIRHAWIDYWLLKDGQPGSAVVTANGAHGDRSYTYSVEQHRYTGHDRHPLNQAEPMLPYQTSVFFSVSHPWISGLRPGEIRVGELPLFLMVLIAWSIFFMGLLLQERAENDEAQAARHPPPSSTKENLGDDPMLRLWLPVGRSWWAIAAGYLGLFAMFCAPVIADVHEQLPGATVVFAGFCVPAPLAIAFGAIAIARLRHNPKLHGWGRAFFGLAMGIVFTIVLIVATIVHVLGGGIT